MMRVVDERSSAPVRSIVRAVIAPWRDSGEESLNYESNMEAARAAGAGYRTGISRPSEDDLKDAGQRSNRDATSLMAIRIV